MFEGDSYPVHHTAFFVIKLQSFVHFLCRIVFSSLLQGQSAADQTLNCEGVGRASDLRYPQTPNLSLHVGLNWPSIVQFSAQNARSFLDRRGRDISVSATECTEPLANNPPTNLRTVSRQAGMGHPSPTGEQE